MSDSPLHHQSLLRERHRALARDAAEARHRHNSTLATRYLIMQLHVRRLLAVAMRGDQR